MNVHFIALGGSAMHSLAIAMHQKGDNVTGSDDAFFDPSKTKLERLGLLPEAEGWFPERIHKDLDAVILGMHAREDNPELIKAQELGLKIYSYPEYLYEQSKNKTRIVVGGSHGKTTTTLMIMHVLQYAGIKFDYMAGAMADGFENSVKISDDAEIAVFEGDEYLTSPLEKTPKFHHYYPHIAIITGIAWDHMNVFPTFENYCEQFQIFADRLEKDGSLIWFYDDPEVRRIAHNLRPDIESLPYRAFEHKIENGITSLLWVGEEYPLSVFGKHNLQNMKAAFEACRRVGVKKYQFFKGIRNFKGAQKRLQLMGQKGGSFVYLDFAHSPSKVQATLHSVKEQFEGKKIVAFFELHTFSSLNKDFLPQYAGTLDVADKAFVYYSPEVVEHKKLEHISVKEVGKFFKNKKLKVLTTAEELQNEIPNLIGENTVYLFMTSGTFGGTDLQAVTKELLY